MLNASEEFLLIRLCLDESRQFLPGISKDWLTLFYIFNHINKYRGRNNLISTYYSRYYEKGDNFEELWCHRLFLPILSVMIRSIWD